MKTSQKKNWQSRSERHVDCKLLEDFMTLGDCVLFYKDFLTIDS